MADAEDLIFLIDVDNTLLNNDLFQIDLQNHIKRISGAGARDRYWEIQEDLFRSLGYRDYLGAFQQYRAERPQDEGALLLASYVIDYPYEKLLFPGALDVIARLQEAGRVVLLTDGDAVFQPIKVKRSGLAAAVSGAVIIAVHKEKALAEIEARFPARHYVLIDDKLRLLSAIKAQWGQQVTTVFPRQGQFAFDPQVLKENPPADITVNQIGDILAERVLSVLIGQT
jgi:FMN phosphatase YigB (HAD superfamily)